MRVAPSITVETTCLLGFATPWGALLGVRLRCAGRVVWRWGWRAMRLPWYCWRILAPKLAPHSTVYEVSADLNPREVEEIW